MVLRFSHNVKFEELAGSLLEGWRKAGLNG